MKNTHSILFLLLFGSSNFIFGQTNEAFTNCDIVIDAGWDYFIGNNASYLTLTGTGGSVIDISTGSGSSAMDHSTGTGSSAMDSYFWTTLDGQIISDPNALSADVNAAGTYIFTIANEDCAVSDTVYVYPQTSENCTSIPIEQIHTTTYCNLPTNICFNFSVSEIEHSTLTINGTLYDDEKQICEGSFDQIQLELSSGFYEVVLTDNESNCLMYKAEVFIENIQSDCNTQEIALVEEWNWISSYLLPASLHLEPIFSNIENDVIAVQNDEGDLYVPKLDVHRIDAWEVSEGYKIKMQNATTLTIQGSQLQPEAIEIVLHEGSQIVPYLRNTPKNMLDEMSSIVDAIVIIRDSEGNVCIPSMNINHIGDFQPGQAYEVVARRGVSFYYSPNSNPFSDNE